MVKPEWMLALLFLPPISMRIIAITCIVVALCSGFIYATILKDCVNYIGTANIAECYQIRSEFRP